MTGTTILEQPKQMLSRLDRSSPIACSLRHDRFSLYDHFKRFFDDERLIYALGYQAKYLGMHPTACSSVFRSLPLPFIASSSRVAT